MHDLPYQTIFQTNLARAKAISELSGAKKRRSKKQPKSSSQASSSAQSTNPSTIRVFPAPKEETTNSARFAQDQFKEAERNNSPLEHAQTHYANASAFSASQNFLLSSQHNFLHPNSSQFQTLSESNMNRFVPQNLGAISPFHFTFYQNYLQQIQRMFAERFFGQRR